MKIDIQFDNLTDTENNRALIEGHLQALGEKINADTATITITQPDETKTGFVVNAHITVPGADLQVERLDETIHDAWRETLSALEDDIFRRNLEHDHGTRELDADQAQDLPGA